LNYNKKINNIMLTQEQKTQFNEILEELGNSLDITENQFNAAVESYKAVGNWLCQEDSLLKPYKPEIKPQGSFLFGTIIKPYDENQDLDIDLVCELQGKNDWWTQKDLKKIVGDQLERHKTYESLLDKEGRRCWTLRYRNNSDRNDKYHMDILPSIIASGYNVLLEKSFSNIELADVDNLAIRITDKEKNNYYTETNPHYWLKANPFGYAKWFINIAALSNVKFFSLNESIQPVPKFQSEKLPLQRVVQILKRHRDMMFKGDIDKPISIIITTLAAKSYKKEINIIEALINIINDMENHILEYNPITGEKMKWVSNPINFEENFADKWIEYPNRQTKFYDWLRQLKAYTNTLINLRGPSIQESLSKSFGEPEVTKAFNNIGSRAKLLAEQGNNRFDVKTGISAGAANIIKPHNFYGSEG